MGTTGDLAGVLVGIVLAAAPVVAVRLLPSVFPPLPRNVPAALVVELAPPAGFLLHIKYAAKQIPKKRSIFVLETSPSPDDDDDDPPSSYPPYLLASGFASRYFLENGAGFLPFPNHLPFKLVASCIRRARRKKWWRTDILSVDTRWILKKIQRKIREKQESEGKKKRAVSRKKTKERGRVDRVESSGDERMRERERGRKGERVEGGNK